MKRLLLLSLIGALFSPWNQQSTAAVNGHRDLNFSIGVATPPDVITGAPSNLTSNSVRLNGSANPFLLMTQGWFEWGASPPLPPGDSTSKQGLGFGASPVPYNATVSGLLPNTIYHYRAVAENAIGRTFGDDVSFTTPPFTRDSAINRVIAQIVNPSPYKNSLVAFLFDPPGADSTLAPGTIVAPLDSEFVDSISSRKWFFWIDLTGDLRFAHPCKFVYVDAATGVVTSSDGEWWPALTAPGDTTVYPWKSINERGADSTSRIYGDYVGIVDPPIMIPSMGGRTLPSERSTFTHYQVRGVLSGNTCAILVGGGAISKGEENAWKNDLDSMNALVSTPPPGGGSPMANEVQMKNNATEADLKRMIDTAAAHGCNSIIFYYSGHGGKSRGGYLYMKDFNVSYCSLAVWLNQGAALKFKDVILDNCYGGLAVPCFTGKSIPVTIITASDSTKTSSGSILYRDKNGNNVFDNSDSIVSGEGKYTGAYMKCWRKLRDSLNRQPTRKEIHEWVLKVNPDSIKQKQNPQYNKFIPTASITRNVTIPGHYDFLGTGVFIDFFNVDNPFDVIVTRVFDPPGGSVNPADLELGLLSRYAYWNIEAVPLTPFVAQIGFELDSASERIPYNRLRIGSRSTPTFPDPNPFWSNHAQKNFIPGPGGGLMLCQNVTHFSQWTFAESIEQITSVDVAVSDKWNMISLPMNVPDGSTAALFPTAVSPAYYFDGGYLSDDSLDNCRGYWMKFPAPATANIGGTQILRDTCPVVSGWNLIGSVTKPLAVGDMATIPPGVVLSGFFGYDAGYVATDSVRPGKGYWVKVAADAQLVFDVFPAAAPKVKASDLAGLHSLTITDAAGSEQTLYFGEENGGSRSLFGEMPPMPPQGAFDARFSSGRWVELYPPQNLRAREFPISLASAAFPLTLRWNIRTGGTTRFSLDGLRTIEGSGSLEVARPMPIAIRLEDAGVPAQFQLAQNYPNPFNPTTRIGYDLPMDAYVTLTVYNLLGKEVVRLVDEPKAAGRYQADVVAGAWASGVYFYKVQAGSFTEIRKMVLLK